MGPLASHSRSWQEFSGLIALMLCVQLAWADYLVLEGLGEDRCPLKGLLNRDFVAGGAPDVVVPGAAASSSSTSRR